MPESTPHIKTFVLGDYQTNCFVVTVPDADPRACWIFDCGFEPDAMFAYIEEHDLEPNAIILTHAHCDHMAGVDAALSRFGPLRISIHVAERGFCSDGMLNLSSLMGAPVTCTEPEHYLNDGDVIDVGGTTWRVLHAPGHSPGCAVFVHDESHQAIAGDTLFAGSMGRVDFPTSNPSDMKRSLEMIMTLPDETHIHPGHGPATTIGEERRTNPFVTGMIAI